MGFFGTGGRNNNGAGQAVSEYGTNLTNVAGAYVNQQGTLDDQSTALANQNYMAGAQQAYGQQQNAAQMLYNQAAGNAPSAADLQMQSGLGQANNSAQSAAYSQQGGVSPGLTQRNMLNSQATQDASIVGQGSAMRAQEQQAAQGQYASILSAMQGEQQSMGQQQYTQGQNNLSYQTQANANSAAMQNAAASNYFNARMGNYNQAAQSAQAGMSQIGQYVGAAAKGAASGLAGGA